MTVPTNAVKVDYSLTASAYETALYASAPVTGGYSLSVSVGTDGINVTPAEADAFAAAVVDAALQHLATIRPSLTFSGKREYSGEISEEVYPAP